MYDELTMSLTAGRLIWRCEYDDSIRLQIEDEKGCILAVESYDTGLYLRADDHAWRAGPTWDERSQMRQHSGEWSWERPYPEYGVVVAQTWRKIDTETIEVVSRLTATRSIRKPHISWGVKLMVEPNFSRYAFAQSMTQMGYTWPNLKQTLWLLSLPPKDKNTARFAGCQGLVAENPDWTSLEFHLRLPPAYCAPATKDYVLNPGESIEIRGAVALRSGAFYQHLESNLNVTGIQIHPPRYSYRKYIELTLENFLDNRKYYPCGKGILYHSAVDGNISKPQIQYWTEGPGWGGACDAENAWNLVLCAQHIPDRRNALLAHARKMLAGWINNPRFRVPPQVHISRPGDLAQAYIGTGWFPDCIWTTTQADLIMRLADIHRITAWEECLPEARQIAEWILSRLNPDGTIPSVWQFPVKYPPELGFGWRPYFSRCNRTGHLAEVLVGPQPVTALFLSTALRHLARADMGKNSRWQEAAQRLLEWAVPQLELPLAKFGGGELDYLVYRAQSIDPTGIAYILWGLAEGYDDTNDSRIPALIRRYMDILCSFAIHWDCDEKRLRPQEKTSLKPYGTDIRLAGGITHGNWMPVYRRGFGGRFHLLMNRNEIADGMYHAWRITRHPQFLNEVENSPVSTRGSCPQNHFWTTDFGNWNNDYALTAFKWTGTYWKLLDSGITESPDNMEDVV